jgi:uncharacterized repeat protein (TIGR01451 family)
MFKSKKRWLLLSIGLLSLGAAGTAAVAIGGGYFDASPLLGQSSAKSMESPPEKPDKKESRPPATPSSAQPVPPDPTEFPAAHNRLAVSPADHNGYQPAPGNGNYVPPDAPPIVRGNDDGSFRPGTPPPVHTRLSDDSAGSANLSPPPMPAHGDRSGEAASSQRFLPPTPAPIANEASPPESRSVVTSSRLRMSDSPAAAQGHEGIDNQDGAAPLESAAATGGAGSVPFDAGSRGGAPVSPPGRFEGGYGRALADEPAARAPGQSAPGYSAPPDAGRYSGGVSQGAGVDGGFAGAAVAAGGATADPGPKQLEGVQTPSLTIEKIAPPEIQVGRQTTFTIKVRNVGQAAAEQVTVFDQTPRGTRYVGSAPEATRAPDGSLMWQLGSLQAGEESTIALQLVPLQEGQIGSVARVAFAAQASASTICTKPLLTVEQTGPSSVLIGESVKLTITISNPGTGVASAVTLEEDVPDGLSHAAGNELEYEVGDLRPGESRKLELTLGADKPGLISNLMVVRGEGNLVAEDRLELEVVAPELDVALSGPSKRYLERQATYSVKVQNPGTAPAKNIELVAYLPKGLKYVSTDNQGQYDAQNHAVYWSLEELPPRVSGEVTVTALPIETGQQKLRVEGRGDLGLSAAYDQQVTVEGLAELFFQVADTADPIEVGSQTEYEIRLINQGSKTDTNVRVTARLPFELKPISGEGPARVQIQGQDVIFEPLARLAPKDSAVFKVRAEGKAQGDHRISVSVVSDEVPTPVTKEESTRVYVDQ